MNMRSLAVWSSVVVAVIAIAFFAVWFDRSSSAESSSVSEEEILALRDDDHIKGNPASAKVTIIEYSDFQCPACASAYDYFRDLETVFPNDVVFAYRHFPLTLIHRNATAAARAAEAAALQDMFQEMHNLLFEKQKEWSERVDVETLFADYAESLGMDRAKFIADYKSSAVKDRVKRDARDARKLNLDGTPTIFVDGVRAQLPRDKETFYASLRERIARATGGDTSLESEEKE